MHQCGMCPVFCNSKNDLIKHVFKRHRHDPYFFVQCSFKGCGATFKTYDSFRMHCSRRHYEDGVNLLENEDLYETMEIEDLNLPGVIDSKSMDAQYLLKLRAGHSLSQAAVQDIVLSTRCLFSERCGLIREKVKQSLPIDLQASIDFDELFSNTLFEGLETEHKQDKYFKESMGYVEPLPVKLGLIQKQVKRDGQYQLIEREIYGYRIPFISQLEQMMSMTEVQSCLDEEVENHGKLLDFFDGMYMQKPFFQNHPNALLFSLYFDDFEIVNPIGSHRKKHKLSAFYWALINISPEFRFKVQATQLLAIAKTSYIKRFGFDSLLGDFVESMKKLYGGYPVRTGRDVKTMYGTLLCVLGDTPAAQLLGGFKEGVGMADKPCRTCEVSHMQLNESLHGSQFPLRNELEHKDRCEHLNLCNKGERKYWSRKYGVTRSSILLNIPEFEVTKCILHDPMHVLLEGVVKMEMQLILKSFIEKKRYFTLQSLNTTILNFSYSIDELKDKPQVLEKKSLDIKNVLPMTAIEIKQLMTLLPFMIGQFIPENDAQWTNFIRLIQITHLVISPISSAESIEKLNQLIYQHHHHFKTLYPDIQFTPKLHYMCHLPDQIYNFGPGRNHWCTRLEAKHGFVKSRKWKNFKAIEKSVAIYQQRWMCLQQSSSGKHGSEVYLYRGDHITPGHIVQKEEVPGHVIQVLQNCGIDVPSHILETNNVNVRGISYRTGSVMLIENTDGPNFGIIQNIIVVDDLKFLECFTLEITDFSNHTNTFECEKTNQNEVDGLCLRALTDAEVQQMLPNKLGPAKKLVLLIDSLKARQIARSITPPVTHCDDVIERSVSPISVDSNISMEQTCSSPSTCSSSSLSSAFSASTSASCSKSLCGYDIPLPKFSDMIKNLLAKDDVMTEWDKFIDETAHHVLSLSRFDSKDHYEMFGKRMFQKYSCIGFFAKDKTKPWTHFTSTLSQKIRHLRWRWKKNKQRSENGNTPEVSKRRKKAPREFLDISDKTMVKRKKVTTFNSKHNKTDHKLSNLLILAVEEENEMTEEAAIQSMNDELSKPYKEQDRPLMIKALRVTFKSRRLFIQSCTADGKAYMKTIVEKYPLLKYADFIQKEFFQLKPALSPEKLEENWVEMLGKLDTVFENVEGEDKELGDEQEEILRLVKQVMDSTYFKATKKDVPLITEVQATKPSIIKTTTPCLVIVRNEDLRLNTTYISHEGVSIDIGKNIKKAIEVLIMLFFVLDLSYPKCHQLLGFLQIALLKDCSPFHRGANLIKFEKKYEQSSGRNNSDEL